MSQLGCLDDGSIGEGQGVEKSTHIRMLPRMAALRFGPLDRMNIIIGETAVKADVTRALAEYNPQDKPLGIGAWGKILGILYNAPDRFRSVARLRRWHCLGIQLRK